MTARRQRFGKKQVCPCFHAKRKFAPLLDEKGQPTGGGKCWSPACHQKFFPPPRQSNSTPPSSPPRPMRREHVYRNAVGDPYMRITVIKQPNGAKKSFAEAWDGHQWVKGVHGLEKLPYRLPQIIERVGSSGTIVICEGEKDCDSADAIGITATCNPFGAGKWLDSMSLHLVGARVTIIPDLDDAGSDHARKVEDSLLRSGVGHVGILDLRSLMPDLPEKSDLSDYLDRGGDPEALRKAVEAACADADDDVGSGLPPVPMIRPKELPTVLADLIAPLEDDRQRMALLMAAITVIGSVLPGVRTTYHGRMYSPGLYLFVIGPPGSGKSVVTSASHLVDDVERSQREAHVEAMKIYEQARILERKQSTPEGAPPPTKPIRRALRVSADSTGSVIIRAVCNNPSVLVFDTEGDTLSNALRPDMIDASSALRKAWHHERIDQERVSEGLYVFTDRPHLSIVLTGAPNQVLPLVKHIESGLTSRFCFIHFPAQKQFLDPFETRRNMIGEHAISMKGAIHDLWREAAKRSERHPLVVELTKNQQASLRKHYEDRYQDDLDPADEATTLRSGVVAVRIITVLTVIRRWFHTGSLDPTMIATDEDFRTGIELAEFLRLGTAHALKQLTDHGRTRSTSSGKDRFRDWYNSLPSSFQTSEAVQLGRDHGISRSTVFNLLTKGIYFTWIARGRYTKKERSLPRGP